MRTTASLVFWRRTVIDRLICVIVRVYLVHVAAVHNLVAVNFIERGSSDLPARLSLKAAA